MSSEHELTAEQEAKVQKLIKVTKLVSMGFLAIAAAHGLEFAEHVIQRDDGKPLVSIGAAMMLKDLLVFSMISMALKDAGKNLDEAIKTKGSDITHLFNGLDGITKGLDKLKVPLLIMGISAVVKQLKAFRD